METEASKLQRPRVTAGPAVTPGGLQSGPGAGGSPRESPPKGSGLGETEPPRVFSKGEGPRIPEGKPHPPSAPGLRSPGASGTLAPLPGRPALSWGHVTRPSAGRGGPHAATSSRRATAGPTEGDQRRDGCAASGSGRWRRRLLGISRAACWPRSPSRPHPTGAQVSGPRGEPSALLPPSAGGPCPRRPRPRRGEGPSARPRGLPLRRRVPSGGFPLFVPLECGCSGIRRPSRTARGGAPAPVTPAVQGAGVLAAPHGGNPV